MSNNQDNKSETSHPRRRATGRSRSFKRVDLVLNTVMANLGLDRRLREHTLFSLWPVLVGERWAARSRPLFIDSESALVITVSDASTGQELSLLKSSILSKVKASARSIGVSISKLRFDLKHYHDADEQDALPSSRRSAPPEPLPGEVDSLNLSQQDLRALSELAASLESNPQPPVAAERVLAVFTRQLKLRRWMQENNFPTCSLCHNPTRSLHGPDNLCLECLWKHR